MTQAPPLHCVLVVIDHRLARVYSTQTHNTPPQSVKRDDANGHARNLHYVQDHGTGKRKPEFKSFYEEIAKLLLNASEILIYGNATGASSAMQQLLSALQDDHPQIARCIVASQVLDTQHLTDDQILAKARDFFEQRHLVRPLPQ